MTKPEQRRVIRSEAVPWDEVRLAWREEMINQIAERHGEGYVHQARSLLKLGNISALDVHLTTLGFPP